MKFALLASGPKGNYYLIKHKDTKLVIDCGTARKHLKGCFEQVSYDPVQNNALLITYTHSDHVTQMKLFGPIPTYTTRDIATSHLRTIRPYGRSGLQDFRITVLPMSHGCEGTVDYIIETEDEKVVYVTDTGYIKNEAKEYIRNTDYYVSEGNHDIEMLMQTTRPVYLKQHIIGDYEHLCNEDYSNILCGVMGNHTEEIVLVHISQEGNTRDVVLTTLKEILKRGQKDHGDLRLYPADQFFIYTGGKSS